jgi:hypothetical protein
MISKKKLSTLAVSLMTTMIFTGCGKKIVDYNIDSAENIQSGYDSYDTDDNAGLKVKLGVPDSYKYSFDLDDTGLSELNINVNDIEVPSTDRMSIVYVNKNSYTNEQKKNLCEKIYDESQGIYLYDIDNQPVYVLEDIIESYENCKKTATDTDVINWCDDTIRDYKSQLATAPDEYESAGDYSSDHFVGTIGDKQFMLYISSDDGANYFSLQFLEDVMEYKPYEGAINGLCYSAEYSQSLEDDTVNLCSLSSDNAEGKAEEFLENVGISNYVLTGIDDLAWEYTNFYEEYVGTIIDGYVVKFSRGIGNESIYDANVGNVDNMQFNDGWFELPSETYTIYVDDNGILGAFCYDLMSPTGETEENVELLTWEQLIEKSKETIPEYYKKYPSQYKDIEFNDVRLTYYIDTDSSKDGQFMYIPVWVFSQYSDENSLQQVVILDARNGSALDLPDIAKQMGCYHTY